MRRVATQNNDHITVEELTHVLAEDLTRFHRPWMRKYFFVTTQKAQTGSRLDD